jgi:hypothetical protein
MNRDEVFEKDCEFIKREGFVPILKVLLDHTNNLKRDVPFHTVADALFFPLDLETMIHRLLSINLVSCILNDEDDGIKTVRLLTAGRVLIEEILKREHEEIDPKR